MECNEKSTCEPQKRSGTPAPALARAPRWLGAPGDQALSPRASQWLSNPATRCLQLSHSLNRKWFRHTQLKNKHLSRKLENRAWDLRGYAASFYWRLIGSLIREGLYINPYRIFTYGWCFSSSKRRTNRCSQVSDLMKCLIPMFSTSGSPQTPLYDFSARM